MSDTDTSDISSVDIGEALSPMPPQPCFHSVNSTDLAHKLAVRIACHMMQYRRPEATLLLEVETSITDTGAMPCEDYAAKVYDDREYNKFERRLAIKYDWSQELIYDWVSTP